MEKNARIYIAGHRGMLGSALVRLLRAESYTQLLTPDRKSLDLCKRQDVERFFEKERPDYVFLVAGRVGGIQDNSRHPADFGRENALIQLHVMEAAHKSGVKKLLFTASSCIYPRHCPQPMQVQDLLTGHFEPTNELYGLAKLFGLKMCQAYQQQYGSRFICGIPCNLFGLGDRYDLENGHVVASLLLRFHEAVQAQAPQVSIWGDGSPRREFMFVDDCAEACLFLMQHYEGTDPVNMGVGCDISIKELAQAVATVTGFQGDLCYDHSRPNGMPQKLMDSTTLAKMGWKARYSLAEALQKTYGCFQESLIS